MNTLCRSAVLILVFQSCSVLDAQEEKKLSLGEQPVFHVSRTNEEIVVDGKMNETSWTSTESRTFEYFYNVDKPDDQQRSTLRMLWDDEYLYVFYEMQDKFLTAREKNRDGQPYFDDCAEIFFITAPDSLDTHIGYELNLWKASNDFVFFNDFYQGQSCVLRTFNPDFKVEVTYEGTLNDNSDQDKGWTMELAIPISNFDGLAKIVPVSAGNQWAFLAVRQDRNDVEGNRHSTSTIFPIYDITKNVHQPNRFGLMKFIK
ncbi:hypothetical protein Pla22_22020 [Rubripirellula amarantea]|uniref:Carbohydrate-binding domain-containing protein n=1 Tax=Rubripirellula amarantea TaxID=2527999 RepID=A0A5C5WUE4_9BACT|nr:hypothetical protein Pla22_22020 [Rubripirellula amarantea]